MLFIYLAPFFVVLGARIFLPADRFGAAQWLGLALSFAGMMVAFGLPTPALDPRQAIGDLMMVGGALFWAATTLIIKASALNRVSAEKVDALPTRGVGADAGGWPRLCSASTSPRCRRRWRSARWPIRRVWVVSVTFVVWFALIARYSANRLSVFTFLTPLFGVAAGHLVLGEPLTPAFAAAVALVAAGLVLVNRAA